MTSDDVSGPRAALGSLVILRTQHRQPAVASRGAQGAALDPTCTGAGSEGKGLNGIESKIQNEKRTALTFYSIESVIGVRNVRRMAYILPILREMLREQYIVNT